MATVVLFAGPRSHALQSPVQQPAFESAALPPHNPVPANSAGSSDEKPALAPVVAPAPEAPAAKPAAVAVPVQPQHRFLDAQNSVSLGLMAASLSGDALSTQKGLAYPSFHEVNPLARPFVQSRAGAAFYSGASFALLSGGMYLAHRTGHHRLERIFPLVVAGWEGALAWRNYRYINARTPAP